MTFYTDGSLQNIGTKDVRMGVGWIQTNSNYPCEKFCAQITNWPSSTRAETLALFTALTVSPRNTMIQVYTD